MGVLYSEYYSIYGYSTRKMLVCPICSRNLRSTSTLLMHIRIVHSNEAGFSIQCNLQGCQRTFKRYNTYRNHIYNFHDTSEFEDTLPSLSPSYYNDMGDSNTDGSSDEESLEISGIR